MGERRRRKMRRPGNRQTRRGRWVRRVTGGLERAGLMGKRLPTIPDP